MIELVGYILNPMKRLCGIDEAGRGAVIGPLVLAGILIDEVDNNALRQINVKDSKLLTKAQRERLFDKILAVSMAFKIEIITPTEIDNAVNGVNNLNLNWLEAQYSAGILNHLNPDKAVIDCPSMNISAYGEYLKKRILNKNIELHPEHKADLNHLVVSAASIIAKVTRDNEIEKIKKSLGIDFGSGYPSDPITVEFMKKNFTNYSEIFRKSWMTVRNFKKEKVQKVLGEF